MSENKLIRVVLLWFLSSEDERYQNKTTLIKLSTQLSTVSMQSNASVSLTSKVVSGPSILEEFGTTLRIDSVNPYTWKRACIKTGIVSNDYLPSYEWSENYHLRLFENVSARTLVCWLWERHPLSEIDAFPTIKFEDLRRCCKKRRRRKEEEGEEEGKEKKKKKKEKKEGHIKYNAHLIVPRRRSRRGAIFLTLYYRTAMFFSILYSPSFMLKSEFKLKTFKKNYNNWNL